MSVRRDLTPPADLVARLMATEGITQDEAVVRGIRLMEAAGGTLAPRGRAMTADRLRQAEVRYQVASRRAEAERQARNQAVRDAIAAGWTHARIAEATSLTRGRVGQIANAKP